MNIVLEAGIAIYVALAVALSVWIGIFVYVWRLDAQARELRRKLESRTPGESASAPSATLRAQKAGDDQPATSQEPRIANAEQ